MPAVLRAVAPLLLLAGALGCGPPDLATRGYLLLSIDTLRADHLGTYGYPLDTSPFLDALAARGVVFERCFSQLPGTLPSHMTMLTGLYPGEHGVLPPGGLLDPSIPMLQEVLGEAGFRTSGHSEGGYVDGRFGFSRGFDEWSDEARKIESDVERTLERGLAFLRAVPADQRFFLFLHTYVVHDPYFPPAEDLALFWDGPAPEAPRPTGPVLSAAGRGEVELSPQAVDFYRASYDASIHYADRVIAGFFAALEELGLADETTIVVTSDHGEEFREHGGMVHEQVYPETLHVPLLVVHPRLEPRRVGSVAGLVDLAPTLYDLAGVPPPAGLAGASLVPELLGRRGARSRRPEAFARDAGGATNAVFAADDDGYRQLLLAGEPGRGVAWLEPGGELVLFAGADRLSFTAFHEPRTIEVTTDGETVARLEVRPSQWTHLDVAGLSGTFRPLRVESATCTVPAEISESQDRRCFAVGFRGLAASAFELYDLAADPLAQTNLRPHQPDTARRLLRTLLRHRRDLTPRAESRQAPLDPELEERLRALGYLD